MVLSFNNKYEPLLLAGKPSTAPSLEPAKAAMRASMARGIAHYIREVKKDNIDVAAKLKRAKELFPNYPELFDGEVESPSDEAVSEVEAVFDEVVIIPPYEEPVQKRKMERQPMHLRSMGMRLRSKKVVDFDYKLREYITRTQRYDNRRGGFISQRARSIHYHPPYFPPAHLLSSKTK